MALEAHIHRARKGKAEELFIPTEREPEDFYFDVESELTEERMGKIFSKLREYKDGGNWRNFVELAGALSQVFSLERIPQDIFTKEVFDVLVETLPWDKYSFPKECLLQTLLSFYPEHAAEYEKARIRHCVELKEDILLHKKHKGEEGAFYEKAFQYVILSPNKKEDIPYTDETFQGSQELIFESQKGFLSKRDEDVRGRAAFRFFTATKNVSFFHPDKKMALLSHPKLGSAAKEVLDWYAAKNSSTFLELASNLAILSADHVNIPSPGRVELVKRPKNLSTTPPLPQHQEYA